MHFLARHYKAIFFLLVALRFVFAFGAFHPDVWNHMDWGVRFFEYGPGKFYAPSSNIWSYTWPNQPPGSILIFAGIRQLYLAIFGAIFWVNVQFSAFPSVIIPFLESQLYPALLKLPAILSDIGIAILILKITKSKFASLVWLVNPVIWYNSAVWGQTDATINFFALLAFYLLTKKKLLFAFVALALCLYIKISLLIFVPVFALALLKYKFKIREVVLGAGISFGLVIFLTTFFAVGHNPITWLLELYSKRVLTEQLQVITANAFNVWASIAGIHEQPHNLPFGPMSYQSWGILLFAPVYLWLLWKYARSKNKHSLWWTLAGASFASWMLLTNMHERYLYPLFPYLTILLGFYPKLLALFTLVSGISLLNLYNFWFTPRVEPIVNFLSFGDRLMPRILGIVNISLFINFLRKYRNA